MAFMRLKPFIGPKRFVFKDPDTGFQYEEATEKQLVQRIVNYRAQNGLPPMEHLHDVLQNYWCGLPENSGNCEFCPTLERKARIKRGIYEYLKGGIALLQTITYPEDHIVSQEEAEKRAERCLKCVYNVFPDKGPFVRWSDEIAEASLGSRRSKHHSSLGNCEVCSCTLKAKVFYKGDMGLDEEQERKMREVGCWQPEAQERAREKREERKEVQTQGKEKLLQVNKRSWRK